MRIAIAQLDPTVGALRANRGLIEQAAAQAAGAGADLLVTSELALCGYPPMDLLERADFLRDQQAEIDALLPASRRIAIALGAALPAEAPGRGHQNAALLLQDGAIAGLQAKTLLPTYDVFDESRYFRPATRRTAFACGGRRIGLSVCEDAWSRELGYAVDPLAELAADGADLLLNLSASPWHLGKLELRERLLMENAARLQRPLVFVNQVGGNDELVFDGGSLVFDGRGRVVARLPLFEPALRVVDLEQPTADAIAPRPERIAELEAGLVLGIRDYFEKQRLVPAAVIGLSGGVDSAVTAHLAARALGPERVLGIAMPGPFSSDHSLEDAIELARRLGIELRTVPITPIYERYIASFSSLIGPRTDYGLAQQNVQSRIRGALLMALSNAESRLVLATGNKSELSMGYCTLYGDTVGGVAVLGDVYKREVYALARHANAQTERIPRRTLDKPPSAELAPGQLDSDDLPPYELLDPILEQLIEGGIAPDAVRRPVGADAKLVETIARRLDRNEYKRRQAPLVLRTSPKAFGSGRRLPIVHRYRSEA